MPRRIRATLIVLIATVAALSAASTAAAAPTARGDFNGDGHADLAVGAPGDSVRGEPSAGAVNVLYGSPRGLSAGDDEQFTKATRGIAGEPQNGARFGAAVAAGDVDDDGFSDVAIGAPGEGIGGAGGPPVSGAVTVLYGSSDGLEPREAGGTWSQDSAGVKGGADARDEFGAALAFGDFDGDGFADLAIGVPGEGVDGQANAGAVNVLYGGPTALNARGDRLWTQNTPGLKGIAGNGHRFGESLAAGDLSEDGRDDLAIGIPGGGIIDSEANAGAVTVLYGRGGGLSAIDDLWSQDARGINGVAKGNDEFGQAVAIGDFDGDGAGDLAVGVPMDTVGGALGAGAVNVIHGGPFGLAEDPDQLWTQDSPGIKSRASVGEAFGSALAAGDFSRDGADELAIGVTAQRVGGDELAGAVTVLYGDSGRGLDDRADQLWTQDSRGVNGRSERGDRMGQALGVGDFDGDGAFDVAIGVPFDSAGGFANAGAINVLYGSGRGLRDSGDELWTQATRGVTGAVGDDRFGASLASGRPGR